MRKSTGLGPACEIGLCLPGVLLTLKFLKRDNHYDGQLILNSVLSGLAWMYDSLEMLFFFCVSRMASGTGIFTKEIHLPIFKSFEHESYALTGGEREMNICTITGS